MEHQYSLIECLHPLDDYDTEVADNLAMVDVGTVVDDAPATAGDGDVIVRCGHLQCGQLSLAIVLKAYRNWVMPQSQIMHLYI